MPNSPELRFDAQAVGKLMTECEGRRFEIELHDGDGRTMFVSLPVASAVELGCMICDVAEHAPYLVGGVRAMRDKLQRG